MDYKMEILGFLLCVIPAIATGITITSNGNSPDIKMKGGMMVDTQKQFEPTESGTIKSTLKPVKVENKKVNDNSSELSINERYRRLIPYMTFYYANDFAAPTTDSIRDVEVQKAEIIETGELGDDNQRGSKKIIYSTQNIPRYQGNRLTQHNIASANPTKVFYQSGAPYYQIPVKVITNTNPLLPDYKVLSHNEYEPGRVIQKPKYQNVAFVSTTRKPILNFYNDDPNIRYYLSEKDQAPKYKLVPYKQSTPIRVLEKDNLYEVRKKPVPVPVLTNNEQIYIKPRPIRPQYVYEEINIPQPVFRKPVIVSEVVYEQQRPNVLSQPTIENGFKPIHSSAQYIKEENIYTTSVPERYISHTPYPKQRVPSSPLISIDDLKPNYHQYVIDQTTEAPPQPVPTTPVSLTPLLTSIQLNKSVPKPMTKENIDASIRTLLQALNALKAVPLNEVEVPVLSTPKPFVIHNIVEVTTSKPAEEVEPAAEPPQTVSNDDLHHEPYLAHVNTPSQYLDETPNVGGSVQQFPPPVTSDDEGGTPGRPGVDYPILTVIPPTNFNCKTQRYKGFFADPETRCQVWHYCDLNGGQASFLCPNGTIFSQAGLTCDWWFNVRCASTTQLYVLNESLYKYILPHTPKFPEDYSGPLVDKYLTLKFKEMEEEFKKNKNKQSASEKMDTGETDENTESSNDSSETDNNNDEETDTATAGGNVSSEPSVIVESPGTSGNVERLRE